MFSIPTHPICRGSITKAGPPKPIPAKKPKKPPVDMSPKILRTMAPSTIPQDLKKELLEATRPKTEKEEEKVLRDVMIHAKAKKIEPDVKATVWGELKTALASKRQELDSGKKLSKPFIQTSVIEEAQPAPKPAVVIKDEHDIPKVIREELESLIISIIKQEKPKTSDALVDKILEITNLVDISITDSRVKLIVMKLRKENKIKFDHQKGWSI